MLSIITRVVIVIAIFTFLSVLSAFVFTAKVDTAIQYFAGYLYSLNVFVNVSTIYDCLTIFLNYFTGVITFLLCLWFIKLTTGNR